MQLHEPSSEPDTETSMQWEVVSDQDSGITSSPAAYRVLENVLSGKETIISHPGASQYEGGIGIAACGLAGLNFVRIVLARVEAGFTDGRLLAEIFERKTSEEIISICARWPSNVHLEVEDIFKVPLFERALNLVSSTYGKPEFKRFKTVLSQLQLLPSEYAAVLITRPPEIITCLKLPVRSAAGKQDVFIIFDSHPRSSHPEGAGLIVNTSIEGTAAHLDNLLAVDDRLLLADNMQWQTQLLANFSGHFFVPKGPATNSVEELTDAVLESSLAMLKMQAEVEDLKFQVSSLGRERQTLEAQVDEIREKYRSLKRAQSLSGMDSSPSPRSYRGSQPQAYSSGWPTQSPQLYDIQSQKNALEYFNSAKHSSSQITKSQKSEAAAPKNALEYLKPSKSEGTSPPSALEYFSSAAHIQRSPSTREDQDHILAQQLQMEIDIDHQRRHGHSNAQAGPSSPRERTPKTKPSSSADRDQHTDDYMLAAQLQRDWERAEREDALTARETQRQWEQEDARLVAERAALQKLEQQVFECGVCFDKFPKDDVAIIANCPHEFCRGCLKSYVESKLTDKLYPIFCPMCLTDSVVVEPGAITDDLVQMLGLTDKEYQILQELQIASLSIMIHCQKCKEGVFVDREEYEAEEIIACPLPRCNHVWCKACQQAIPMNGPKHSCDGSSELDHLMKRRGWKHCPGCKTPFQKSSGCNHMTCMAPGCNTHFCYVCGESIVRSALQRDVKAAVSAHYRRCRLFEDVADR